MSPDAAIVGVLVSSAVAWSAVPWANQPGHRLRAARRPVERTRLRHPRPRATRRNHEQGIVRDLPELVDLLILAVEAGHPLSLALSRLGTSAPVVFREGFDTFGASMARGSGTEAALTGLIRSWGAPAHGLGRCLLDHVRYGTPVIPALVRCADEARSARRRAAETRARRLPVLLLFPLVTCTLPAFGLLTVAPMVASTLDSLDAGPLGTASSPSPPSPLP